MLVAKELKLEVGKIFGFVINDKEVVGKVVSFNDTEVVVQEPHHIVFQPPAPGEEPQMAFAPYVMMAEKNVVFYFKDISGRFNPADGFLTAYESAMSDIILPTNNSKLII